MAVTSYTAVIPSQEDAKIVVPYKRYIDFCHFEWYEKLQQILQIKKASVKSDTYLALHTLYSVGNFTKTKHLEALKLIDNQLTFKRKTEPLKFEVKCRNCSFSGFSQCNVCTHKSDHYCSYYCAEIALTNIKLDLEEHILQMPSELVDRTDVLVSRMKYIRMCRSEWLEGLNNLGLQKRDMDTLKGHTEKVYSSNVFTEQMHERLMRAIAREKRFITEVSAMKSPDGMRSYYTPILSVVNLQIALDNALSS